MSRPVLFLFRSGLISLALIGGARGTTYNWANVTGVWSAPNNWSPIGPPSGADSTDILVFGGDVGVVAGSAPNYTSTNDIATTPFVLNGVTLQATDLNNQPTDPPHIITGNPLRFAGSTPTVRQNGAGPVTFNTQIGFSSGLTFEGNGTGAVTLNRGLSGSGTIIKSGTSTFRFGTFPILPAITAPSENTWIGNLVLNGGVIRFNNNADSGRTALRANGVTLSIGTTVTCSSEIRTGVLSGPGGLLESQVTVSNSDNENVVITALDNGAFGGTVRLGPPTGTGNDTGTFTVRGPGTQILSGALNIEKDVSVGGSLVLSGAATLGAKLKGAVVMQGGSFRLDNFATNDNNRLRDANSSSTGIDVIGGGIFTLDGNAAGTSETVGRLQLGSLAGANPRTRPRAGHLDFDLVHRGGATVLSLQSYNRDATTAPPLNTVEFSARDASNAPLNLGDTGNNPRVFFNSVPALVNSLLPTTAGSTQTGWAVVRTVTGLAFATHAANGIAPVPTSTTWTSGVGQHLENSEDQSVSGTFTAASLRLVPTGPGHKITLNGGASLSTTGIVLTGGQDFEIAGFGALAGNGARFIHVDAGTLRVSAGIGNAQPIAKSGRGTLDLANGGNSTNLQPISINQGSLRVRLSPSTVPGGELQLRGGVLEFEGGGSFSRALVTASGVAGANTINWAGSELTGSPAVPTNLVEDRGSGGFAAIGGSATVDLGPVGASAIRWEDRSFLQSGYALVLGSVNADSAVTMTDNFNLTSAEVTVNYNAREIRVIDNPASSSDRGILSGVISGTIHNDLLKTGSGVLELTGTCSFAGAAIIQEGTLDVTGSISQSIVADVRAGATLTGTGSVGAIILEAGGIVAPGRNGVGILTGTSLAWRGNGTARFDLGAGGSSDRLDLGNGSLRKGTDSGPFTVDFGGGGALGQSYTLISFGSTDFAATDFVAANLLPGVTGSFQVSGGNLLFVTDAPPAPDVVTGTATDVAITAATLNGTVNPRGGATTARFEYGTSLAYGSFLDVTPAPGDGFSPLPVSVNATNLQPNSLYHFRLVATNPGGTTNGLDQTFTTQPAVAPTVTTGLSSNLTANSADLGGTINPNGTATTAVFEYGTTTAYGSTAPVSSPGGGTSPVEVLASLSNLQSSTTYHYRLVATNVGGTTQGQDATFTTPGMQPIVVTSSATNITDKAATLNGSVNPQALETTAFFEYGLTTSYGQTANVPSPGSGSATVPVSANIAGLLPNSTYHFRLVAQSSAGTSLGDNQVFVTAPPVTDPEPADDSVFVSGKAVTFNVLANDINPVTGDSTGLTFDTITVQPQFGTVTGNGTLTYTPSKKFPSTGDSFTYRVTNGQNQTAEAVVRIRDFSVMKGDFGATIEEEGPGVSDTGSLVVTLSATGKCTAKLVWERKSYSIKGAVPADGNTVLIRPKIDGAAGQNLTIRFSLDVDGSAPGVIEDDATGETYDFSLTRGAADTDGLLIAAGVYNAWMPSSTGDPGTAFVSVNINKKGVAKLVGRTADGEAFSDSSKLFGHQYLLDPLLYKTGKKAYAGQLRSELSITGGQTIASTSEWFKDVVPGDLVYPGGVAVERPVEGEQFLAKGENGFTAITTALGGTSVNLVLEGGNLTAQQVVPITLSSKKITVGSTTLQNVKVKLNTKQGTFSGSFTHPVNGQKTEFGGAFRKNQSEGRGQFRGVSVPGEVRITAIP